jgi:hypothetical protein
MNTDTTKTIIFPHPSSVSMQKASYLRRQLQEAVTQGHALPAWL